MWQLSPPRQILYKGLLSIILAFGLVTCAERPNTAPKDFQELTSFLYEHLLDEDDEELVFGVENMYDWINQNTSSVRKGYTVKNLSAEAIATTGKYSNPSDLIGGAVLTAHGHDVIKTSRALGVDNVRETNGDSYETYTRTYEGDAECFARRECNTLEGDSRSTSKWVGVLEIKYDTHVQFRWVNTRYGPVMLHRSYMNKKPELNLDLVDAKQGYYLGIVFPPFDPRDVSQEESNPQEVEMSSEGEQDSSDEELEPNNMIAEAEEQSADADNDMLNEEFTPSEIDLEVDEAVQPTEEGWGKSSFLQVNWLDVDYGILPVTEDRALEMLVDSLVSIAVATEKWMDKNYGTSD